MHIACPWSNLAILTNDHISRSLISAVLKKVWRRFVFTLAECQRTNMCINTRFPLPRTHFPSSAYRQLLFPHPVPSCFSVYVLHACCTSGVLPICADNFYVYLLHKYTSEEKTSEWAPCRFQAAGSGKLWQFVEGADRCPAFHNLFSVVKFLFRCSRHSSPEAGRVRYGSLWDRWSLAWAIADYTWWCSSGGGGATKAAFHLPLSIREGQFLPGWAHAQMTCMILSDAAGWERKIWCIAVWELIIGRPCCELFYGGWI